MVPTPNWSRTVVAFDLDDTLYKERTYQQSGLQHVARSLAALTGQTLQARLDASDPLGDLGQQAGLTERSKASLLWMYRLHAPSITLEPGAGEALEHLSRLCRALAVITDGRSLSQRIKLLALGLGHLEVLVSEDFGAEKPDPARFTHLMKIHPDCRYVYMGDNLAKDFTTPNQLGWLTVGLRDDGRNVHSQNAASWPVENQPSLWVSSWAELVPALSKSLV